MSNPEQADEGLSRTSGGSAAPGVHHRPAVRAASAVTAALAAAEQAGQRGAVLDLAGVMGKEEFLDRCARALEFPDTFGRNWDALHDALTDLSWWGPPAGCVILVPHWDDFQQAAPESAGTAREIFTEAVASWQERGRSMTFLLG
ncbi:barstar family protein [Streptomyces sp. ACA25]|uniref:barstar family protein n=1 Tax=Streptomyces sp. ACA25 TaxID=3022596 RepID=UPI0023079D70|nr:barstar family protein [Streptomyces sp. ACA25]MDB1088399.1 barstar family protein [Streptomyces sp. ACA25]